MGQRSTPGRRLWLILLRHVKLVAVAVFHRAGPTASSARWIPGKRVASAGHESSLLVHWRGEPPPVESASWMNAELPVWKLCNPDDEAPSATRQLFACADFEHPGATLRARSFRSRASVLHGDGLGALDLALSLALHAVTSGGAGGRGLGHVHLAPSIEYQYGS